MKYIVYMFLIEMSIIAFTKRCTEHVFHFWCRPAVDSLACVHVVWFDCCAEMMNKREKNLTVICRIVEVKDLRIYKDRFFHWLLLSIDDIGGKFHLQSLYLEIWTTMIGLLLFVWNSSVVNLNFHGYFQTEVLYLKKIALKFTGVYFVRTYIFFKYSRYLALN